LKKTNLNPKINTPIVLGFIGLIIAGFTLRYLTYDAAYINAWVTRDFDRAFNLVDGVYFPLVGSEMNNGGRLPGPFLYLLLAIPISIKSSYESIIAFNFLLNCVSVIGLFFVVKKFFGIYIGFLSTALLSLNLTHIGAAGFPFNPSYIFILIPLYLWFVFELGINRNIKFLPWIVLIISLGIQLHYSLATFYIVPVLLVFLLRLKISFKPIILSVLLAAICFTPYSIYLKQTINPKIESKGTFEKPDFSILERAIKFPIVGNTLDHLTFKNGQRRNFYFDKKIATIYYALTLISMCFLAWRIYKVTTKTGFQNANKELSLLLVFYAPALIYEVINPVGYSKNPHTWYFFIFIMPQLIMIAFFLVSLFQKMKTKGQQSIFLLATIGIITSLAINAYADVQKSSMNLKKDLFSGEFNNFKKLHGSLMQTLQLSPEDYVNKIYFEGFSPNSLKALKSVKYSNDYTNDIHLVNLNEFNSSKNQSSQAFQKFSKNKFCYFIIQEKDFLNSKFYNKNDFIRERLAHYVTDETILRFEPALKMGYTNYKKLMLISKYKPKNKQSCYTNGLNNFSVEKKTRDLLISSNPLDVNNDLDMKVISRKADYDSNNELISFRGEYLVFDKFTSSPFQFALNIKKDDNGYIIQVSILRYYYFNKMDLAICSEGLQTRLNKKSCTFVNIFPKNTLASTIYAYNHKWEKTILLPKNVKIIKEKQFFKLTWSSKKIALIDSKELYSQDENTSVIALN
jgi:hypothetical protein